MLTLQEASQLHHLMQQQLHYTVGDQDFDTPFPACLTKAMILEHTSERLLVPLMDGGFGHSQALQYVVVRRSN